MTPDIIEILDPFFADVIPQEESAWRPRAVTADEVLEVLWSINPVFTPFIAAMDKLEYQAKHEPRADQAIRLTARTPFGFEPIKEARTVVKKIIYERHKTALTVAKVNKPNYPLLTLPAGLGGTDLAVAAFICMTYDQPKIT